MRMMNKNTATLKPRNQLPVKYAVMLKRPVAFKRVRMKRGHERPQQVADGVLPTPFVQM